MESIDGTLWIKETNNGRMDHEDRISDKLLPSTRTSWLVYKLVPIRAQQMGYSPPVDLEREALRWASAQAF
jgi:hypothetical protein